MSQFVSKLLKFGANNSLLERSYGRWAHRRPLKVYEPKQTASSESQPASQTQNDPKKIILSTDNDVSNLLRHKVQPIKSGLYKNANVKSAINDVDEESKDIQTLRIENGEITFKKLKQHDKILSTLMLSLKSRKRREQQDTVLLEGIRLIRDALLVGCKPIDILFSRVKEVNEIVDLLPKDSVTLYRVPYKELQVWSALTTCPGIVGIFQTPDVAKLTNKNALPLTVICDNIREPGNLGAIIRCTAAVGCRNLLLTKGCVELWDTKVLRSASGGHFRTAIDQDVTWEEVRSKLTGNPAVFIADNKSQTSSLTEIPLVSYDDIHYAGCPEIVLVIGGETCGISEEAYQLAKETVGVRLHIPLVNGVESLNTATALGIIMFEIKRQIKRLNKVPEKARIQR